MVQDGVLTCGTQPRKSTHEQLPFVLSLMQLAVDGRRMMKDRKYRWGGDFDNWLGSCVCDARPAVPLLSSWQRCSHPLSSGCCSAAYKARRTGGAAA